MEFKSFSKIIGQLLEQDRIGESLTLLIRQAGEMRLPSVLDHAHTLRASYDAMVKSISDGNADPDASGHLALIKRDIEQLVTVLNDNEALALSPGLYFRMLRNLSADKRNFPDLYAAYVNVSSMLSLTDPETEGAGSLRREKSELLGRIFNTVFTLRYGKIKDFEAVCNLIRDTAADFSLRAMLISAVTLNLLERFDIKRFDLFAAAGGKLDNNVLLARYVVGICLLLDCNRSSIDSKEHAALVLEGLVDAGLIPAEALEEVVMAIIRTRGALQLTDSMKSSIMPDLMKYGPDLMKKLHNGDGSINLENLEEDSEWEEMMAKSGLEEKLQRLNEMRNDGADMMLMMFGQVAQGPFFRDMDHWFRPFEQWQLEAIGLPASFLPLVEGFKHMTSVMCDLDKYGLLANMQRMPEASREIMLKGLDGQIAQLREESKSDALRVQSPELKGEIENYVKSLYRFFTFFKYREEFRNPFDSPLSFMEWPVWRDKLANRDIIETVAEHYLRCKFYREAIPVFETLTRGDLDGDAFQKLGYCKEKTGDYDGALRAYAEAAVLNDNDKIAQWLSRHEAICLMAGGRYEDVVEKCEEITGNEYKDSEQVQIKGLWIEALMKLGKFDKVVRLLSPELFEGTANLDSQRTAMRAAILGGIVLAPELNVLNSRLQDIDMLVAGYALNVGANAESDTSAEEHGMAGDLILASLYSFMQAILKPEGYTEFMREGVSFLAKAFALKNAGITRPEMRKMLLESMKGTKILTPLKPLVPMLVDAASK